MNPKIIKYIKVIVRTISVTLALFGLFWACLMLWTFSDKLASEGFLERLAMLVLFITLPVVFIASSILIVREWSKRAIQLFSLLFSLALASSLAERMTSLPGMSPPMAAQTENMIWAISFFVFLVLIYAATRKLLIVTTAPQM